jgi:hypothetical protein
MRAFYCLIMSSQERDRRSDDMSYATISRRTVLAASGVVAVGGLAGCLDRVASSVTNTGASPASVFAGGGGGGGRIVSGEPRVSRLTPTLSGGSGVLSGEVDLEGWVTSVALLAANYNNSRSNRSTIRTGGGDSDADGIDDDARGEDYNTPRSNRSIARPVDFFGDDVDEDDETFRVVSRLDAQLQEATAAAASSISKRSARTGRNPETEKEITAALDEMAQALAEMQAVLKRCSEGSCVTALENVGHREADVQRAREHVENGEWAAFGMTDEGGNDIVVGDYLLPPAAFDPSGLFSAGEQAALFRYLNGGSVVGERFTVCLADAEVPGGNGSIRDAVTPKRLIDYVTGRADGRGGSVYAWGENALSAGESEDCDDSDSAVRPGDVCGSPHLSAAISGLVATGGGLESFRTSDGTVTVINTPPRAEGGASVLVCPRDGTAYEPDDLSEWGRAPPPTMEAQGRLNELTVAQVMVQPPGCPHPFPALLYVGRGVSDGQLVYSGGWVIDDAALYADAFTVMTMQGTAPVVGIDFGDLDSDGDGLGDVVEQAVSTGVGKVTRRRRRRGARLDTGTANALVDAGVFSEELFDPDDSVANAFVRFRSGGREGGVGELLVTHLALDAPVLHLVNAGGASNEVKFKAGAELSKSMN